MTATDNSTPFTMPEIVGRPPPGWLALIVIRKTSRKWDWVALMVHPDDCRPDGTRTPRQAWVRVPGKHRNEDAAWNAFRDMIATRH